MFPGSLDAFRVRNISIERGDIQRDKKTVAREIAKCRKVVEEMCSVLDERK